MRYPNFLKENGNIGFVAPSFGCVIEPYRSGFENALKIFNKMGYKTTLGSNCFEDKGVGISNTPNLCAKELIDMYVDDSVDFIISCGGGELMCEILPFMDFKRLQRANPKWFLGYSDNTNFTFTSAILCDNASIYGPCAPTFGMEPWYQSLYDTWDLITGKKLIFEGYEMWERESKKDGISPLEPYNLTEKKQLQFLNCDDIEDVYFNGRLIGGCLDTLVTLSGTRFDKVNDFCKKYKKDGIIWFLESCDLTVLQIRRALWQLRQAGWFENAVGFIFGRPLHFDETQLGLDRVGAVSGAIEDLKIPVILDADFGHLPPSLPIICGALAQVEVIDGNIRFSYSLS